MAKKQQKFKVHDPNTRDGTTFASILAAGGLAGQAGEAASKMQQDMGAGVQAFMQLVLGALANSETNERTENFLFELWKTTEDGQASEDDLDIAGRLKPKFRPLEPGEDPGWMTRDELLDRDTLYYRKYRRFRRLGMAASLEIAGALFRTENFADFLESARILVSGMMASTEPQTESNGTTDSHPAK